MAKTLEQIAKDLKDEQKKVQLIYAFNGTGKTRLSREFKELIAPKDEPEETASKILYYNAFTEDLFYWDNDLEGDDEASLKIQPNAFTDWVIRDRGQDGNIVNNFQRYTSRKITPAFIEETKQIEKDGQRINQTTYPKVSFSFSDGDAPFNVKISKGEESNFVWSIFYALLEEVVEILKEPIETRDDDVFNTLEYVFIDDPVSSLDDNHLIELAVDIAKLVKSSQSNLKFIITTHNPLFYNVLSNEFNNKVYKDPDTEARTCIYKPKESQKYRLDKKSDGTFVLTELGNNTPFSYHLFLLSEIKTALSSEQIKKYHFSFMRNILEKTATFLGHKGWVKLLPNDTDGNPDPFINRILNHSSHSAHAGDEIGDIEGNDIDKLQLLVDSLSSEYKFRQEAE